MIPLETIKEQFMIFFSNTLLYHPISEKRAQLHFAPLSPKTGGTMAAGVHLCGDATF